MTKIYSVNSGDVCSAGGKRLRSLDSFTTHNGAIVTGDALAAALAAVADDWAQLGRDIHAENAYAPHVTQAAKDANLADMLAQAERIRNGDVSSFAIVQRLNTKLTGECIPLFRS